MTCAGKTFRLNKNLLTYHTSSLAYISSNGNSNGFHYLFACKFPFMSYMLFDNTACVLNLCFYLNLIWIWLAHCSFPLIRNDVIFIMQHVAACAFVFQTGPDHVKAGSSWWGEYIEKHGSIYGGKTWEYKYLQKFWLWRSKDQQRGGPKLRITVSFILWVGWAIFLIMRTFQAHSDLFVITITQR